MENKSKGIRLDLAGGEINFQVD